jgi:SAM-dependent methyltransferase
MQKQFGLFEESSSSLETSITRQGDSLCIPEGLNTIPCTHGLHRFPGKYIPNICRYILRSNDFADSTRTVLDPFCGSGTTLVEAALEGRRFVGVDIDPLGVMISKAKTEPLSDEDLRFLQRVWARHDFSAEDAEMVPPVANLAHWFTDEAIRQLSSIKAKCLTLSGRLRTFSLVVFSSIIRRVSNADDQTQKTYVSHTHRKTPPLPSAIFPLFLERAITGMREYVALLPNQPSGIVLRGNAGSLNGDFDFDDIITSPPYIDSIDYVYNQMLEYFWLLAELGVTSHEGFRQMRKEPMGFNIRKAVFGDDETAQTLSVQRKAYEDVCAHIGARSPKEEMSVRSFFRDFMGHIRDVRSKQKECAKYVCIIGNSYIRGVTVPTSEILVDAFQHLGYRLADRTVYEIRRHYMKFPRRNNSGKITIDHILVFEAT